MTPMGKHSKLTVGQCSLATAIAILALLVSPLFFAVMFVSVNHLLAPSFGWLAWTVPVATELSFVILYLLELLLDWLDRAPGWLRAAPYPFAAASLALNVYAAHGDVPGMIGHAVVTVAFFLPLIALKTAVHRFTASDEDRRRATAVSDAIAHAKDILRAADRWWRLRAPVMLRRQLRTRRLPAAVMDAISRGARDGGASKWEPAVEAWITRSLALPEGVSVQLAAAREAVIQSASRSVPVDASQGATGIVPASPAEAPRDVSESTSREVPAATSGSTSRSASGGASRKTRIVPAKATNDELAELVAYLFDQGGEVKPYGVIKAIKDRCGGKGIGYGRAEEVMALAERMHGGRVVALEDRRRA